MTKSEILKKKLQYYNKPFITKDFLQQLFDKFAPWYTPAEASKRWIISPIKSWQIYRNMLYTWNITRQSILWKYMKWKKYMIGWIYIYNRYWLSTQLANKITVYNTIHSWPKEIAGARFIFHKVRKSFFRWKKRRQSQDVYYYIMTPERALIELLNETNGNPEFVDDICYQIKTGKVDTEKIKKLCNKHCSKRLQHLVYNFLKTCSKQ